MHPNEAVASIVVLAVAAIAAVLAALALGARRRSGNSALGWVAGAFALFAVKGVVTAASLWLEVLEHHHLELVTAFFDLATVALLVMPVLRR